MAAAVDKHTGKPVFQCRVVDLDPELEGRSRETVVKILADRMPTPPTRTPFETVEFEGLQVTPYVDTSRCQGRGRCGARIAFSLRATTCQRSVSCGSWSTRTKLMPQVWSRSTERIRSSDSGIRSSAVHSPSAAVTPLSHTASQVSSLLVSANTMAMSIRERTREVAVLKTLGFTRRAVLGLFVGEAVALSLVGGIVGALGAYMFVYLMIHFLQAVGFFITDDLALGRIPSQAAAQLHREVGQNA